MTKIKLAIFEGKKIRRKWDERREKWYFSMESKGLEENKISAKKGGRVVKNARIELEQKTGKRVISGSNYLLHVQR